MKYRIYVAALLLLHSCVHAENVSGKSFFSDLQDYSLFSLSGYMSAADQHHDDGHVLNKSQTSATIFGGRSEDVYDLQEYFLFNGKHLLRAQEYDTIAPGNALNQEKQDILFGDFNVQTKNTAQASILSVFPEQKRIGLALSMRYGFKDKWWLCVDAPFVRVKNAINLVESYTYSPHRVIDGVAGFDGDNPTVTTMFEAFRQKGMNYGRIDGVQKKAGLADLTVRVGCNSVNKKNVFMSQSLGLIFPTGNRPTAEYVWEPIVGNNKHFGITFSNGGHYLFNETTRGKIWVSVNMESKYLLENTQKRSLDLKNGPWTRYLAMYADNLKRTNDERTFGINLMTKDVKVRPGTTASFGTKFNFISDNWNISAGVISRYRQAERVSLVQDWQRGPQIANLGTASTVIPTRRMGECINANAAIAGGAAPVDYYIQESDIDFNSAAHPALVSYTFHTTAAYYNHSEHPQNYEAGLSYDFSEQNTTINRWSAWAKLQVSF
jgi:hypothetical protein